MSSELTVGDVMTNEVITIPKEKSLLEGAELMKKWNVGSLIVVEGKKAVGIITERDIVNKVVVKDRKASEVKVSEVMSSPIKVVKPETTIEEAARLMKKEKIKRLPVINERNELVGIISEGDIAKVLPSVVDLLEERALLQ